MGDINGAVIFLNGCARPERDRALRRLADADHDEAAFAEGVAHELLDRDCGGLVHDVEIERWRQAGQARRYWWRWARLPPHLDHARARRR